MTASPVRCLLTWVWCRWPGRGKGLQDSFLLRIFLTLTNLWLTMTQMSFFLLFFSISFHALLFSCPLNLLFQRWNSYNCGSHFSFRILSLQLHLDADLYHLGCAFKKVCWLWELSLLHYDGDTLLSCISSNEGGFALLQRQKTFGRSAKMSQFGLRKQACPFEKTRS